MTGITCAVCERVVIFQLFLIQIAFLPSSSLSEDSTALPIFVKRPCFDSGNFGNNSRCGITLLDEFVRETIVSKLRGMADSTAGIAKTEAALSVYDFESNTITHGSNFTTFPGKLHLSDRMLVRDLTMNVAKFIRRQFTLSSLYLTKPLFFSIMDSRKNDSDYSFWHIDNETKSHFHYSALLYLDDGGGVNFSGGHLLFLAPSPSHPIRLVPRSGRLVAFTSGAENPHKVSVVKSGRRRALTMFFTKEEEKEFNF